MATIAYLVGPGLVVALIAILLRIRGQRMARLLREVRERDPYLEVTEQSARSLGLTPAELTEVASSWRFPPLALSGDRVRADLMLSTFAGRWQERAVIAGTAYQLLSTGGGAEDLCYLQVTAAMIKAPVEPATWVAAAPAGSGSPSQSVIRDESTGTEITMWGAMPTELNGLFAEAAGDEVPAPVAADRWQIRAADPALATALMKRVPGLLTDPGAVWRIDGTDFVHIKPVPYGAAPLDTTALSARLDLVCRAAQVVDELIMAGRPGN